MIYSTVSKVSPIGLIGWGGWSVGVGTLLDLPPQDHRSQDDTPSPHQQHLERASSAQDLEPQGHQPRILSIKRPKIDPWSQRLGKETIKQFEELARNFAEQDTIEDIVNWDKYLLEQLDDEDLIKEYNAWSEMHFKPEPCVDSIVFENPEHDSFDFLRCLSNANWNVGNESLDMVSSMMLYGRRLRNKGLFMLGTFQRFWLVLRLNMWAISPQKTDPQLRELYGVADGQPGGVLGLRYKPIGDESTASVLFFFPLGYVLHNEAIKSYGLPDKDCARWIDDVAEWTDIPYILALGIREDGHTELRKDDSMEPNIRWTEDRNVGWKAFLYDGQEQYYFIHNPTYNSDISHTPTEGSDDDAQDIIFCHNPPPYTVARVKRRLKHFLDPRISLLQEATNIDLEPLSLSTPEIVETYTTKGKDGEYVRVGLFPK